MNGTRVKIAYGPLFNLDSAVETGVLDGGDILITSDLNEHIFIEPETDKAIHVQSVLLRFDDITTANAYINTDNQTYPGKQVMIKDEDGLYQPFIIQESNNIFFVTPVVEKYEGDYSFVPSADDFVIDTAGKTLKQNIEIKPIPCSEVTNNSGGKTFTIG